MRSSALFTAAAATWLTSSLAQTVGIIQPDLLETDDQLAGEVIGVGAEGTTYIVSNLVTDTTDGDIAYTETIVQDATHVSLALSLSIDASDAVTVGLQCTYASQSDGTFTFAGNCAGAELDVEGGTSIISTVTGSATLVAIPITVSTASSVSATAAGSGSASGSKTTAAPASGVSSGSGAKPSATTTSSATSLKLCAMGIMALPALSALSFLLM